MHSSQSSHPRLRIRAIQAAAVRQRQVDPQQAREDAFALDRAAAALRKQLPRRV